MAPEKHSRIGASSASRWMSCPGSVAMCKTAENKSSVFASEGTAAHGLCERCLKEGISPKSLLGIVVKADGRTFCVDDEMEQAVAMYVNHVRTVINGLPFWVEREFSLAWIHPEAFGTNDCSAIDRANRTLYIFDYKHGKGKAVFAKDNPQLKYYALGALGEDNKDVDRVVLTIVQPRNELVGIDTWEMSASDLYKWGYEVLKPAAELAMSPNAPCVPGQEQCRWCSGINVCPAVKREVSQVAVADIYPEIANTQYAPKYMQYEEPVMTKFPDTAELSTEQVKKLLDMSGVFRAYLDAVEKEAYTRVVLGEEIAGYKLVRKRANREWLDEKAVVSEYERVLGEDLYERKLLSPAKLEKIVGKGELDGLVTTKQTGLSLVPASDKRKAVSVEEETELQVLELFFDV